MQSGVLDESAPARGGGTFCQLLYRKQKVLGYDTLTITFWPCGEGGGLRAHNELGEYLGEACHPCVSWVAVATVRRVWVRRVWALRSGLDVGQLQAFIV
jgi:hypothetical protein